MGSSHLLAHSEVGWPSCRIFGQWTCHGRGKETGLLTPRTPWQRQTRLKFMMFMVIKKIYDMICTYLPTVRSVALHYIPFYYIALYHITLHSIHVDRLFCTSPVICGFAIILRWELFGCKYMVPLKVGWSMWDLDSLMISTLGPKLASLFGLWSLN